MDIDIKTAVEIATAMLSKGEPFLLVGSPGIGKTDIITQACDTLGFDMLVEHPVLSDPTDMKGLPWIKEGAECATFVPFGNVHRILNAKKPLVVFIDDIGQASPSVQASYMQPILARRINGHDVPDCVRFAAATNRRQDRADVSGVLEPVKSRFTTIIHLSPDCEAWMEWAVVNGIRPEIRAFINWKPELFHRFEPTADITNSPCPRTWAAASRLADTGLKGSALHAAVAGAVGDGAATELIGFLHAYGELPSYDEIAAAPDTARIPVGVSSLYAVAAMVADNTTNATLKTAFTYALRLPEEFGVLLIRDIVRANKNVIKRPEFLAFLKTELGKLISGR